jgi:addiction module RelB/DinJ family antitoxin
MLGDCLRRNALLASERRLLRGTIGLRWGMPVKDTYVRARIEPDLKAETEIVLERLGLTTTEAIRLFLTQVRLRGALPFPIALPADDDLLMPTESRQAALDSVYDD